MPDIFGNPTLQEMTAQRQRAFQGQVGDIMQSNMARASTGAEKAGVGVGSFLGALGAKYLGKPYAETAEGQAVADREAALSELTGQDFGTQQTNQMTPEGGMTTETKQLSEPERLAAEGSAYLKYAQEYNSPEARTYGMQLQQKAIDASKALKKQASIDEFALSVAPTDPVSAKAIRAGLIDPLEYQKQALAVKKDDEQAQPIIEFERKGNVVTQKWDKDKGDYITIAESPKTNAYRPLPEALELIGQEKRIAKLEETRAKGIGEREADAIASGTLAVESVPVLSRSLELLGSIRTGNTEGILLKGKRFLGVESGDEAELVNNLQKRVIAQLKPVFGSQFTAREGDWLREIEASEAKSTEANIRLMKTGINLARERATVGLEAAKYAGDAREAKRLQNFLESTPEQSLSKAEESSKASGYSTEAQKLLDEVRGAGQ